MAVHSLKAVQNIPVTLDRAWDFFSDPDNLPLITPPFMSFTITSPPSGKAMYPGQLIEYTVAPVAGIKLYWMTEVTQVRDLQFFIDEQRFGPYAMWHHQHHFREIDNGIEMTDLVHYKNPAGLLGEMVNPLLVRPKLKKIFEYRYGRINELLGSWPGQNMKVEIR